MSTLKVDAIRHNSATSDAITTAADGTCTAKLTSVAGGPLSNRNLFVNGACRIGQRGSTSLGSGYGGVDRWVQFIGGGGATTTSQDTDVPTGQGFRNSIKLDVTTALASGSSNWAWLGQYIEAQDCQSVCKGTSNAKQLTLQFWVKSPKTGTHTVRLDVSDSNDGVGATYTVSSANTWEKKTVTFPASTSGTINDDNGRGIQVFWVLSAGTTYTSGTLNTTWASWTNANTAPGQPNILDSTDNNFYLTGVQLEVGDTATSFEHRSYGEELARCQRYYQQIDDSSNPGSYIWGIAYGGGGNSAGLIIYYPTTMRALPTASGENLNNLIFNDGRAAYTAANNSYGFGAYEHVVRITSSSLGSMTGKAIQVYTASGVTNTKIKLDAEL